MNEACKRNSPLEQRQARLVVTRQAQSDHRAGIVATSLKRLDGVSRERTEIASRGARVAYAPAESSTCRK